MLQNFHKISETETIETFSSVSYIFRFGKNLLHSPLLTARESIQIPFVTIKNTEQSGNTLSAERKLFEKKKSVKILRGSSFRKAFGKEF